MRFNERYLVADKLLPVRRFMHQLVEAILSIFQSIDTSVLQGTHRIENHVFVRRLDLVVKLFRRLVGRYLLGFSL
jgi:hypothetical protein